MNDKSLSFGIPFLPPSCSKRDCSLRRSLQTDFSPAHSVPSRPFPLHFPSHFMCKPLRYKPSQFTLRLDIMRGIGEHQRLFRVGKTANQSLQAGHVRGYHCRGGSAWGGRYARPRGPDLRSRGGLGAVGCGQPCRVGGPQGGPHRRVFEAIKM